MRELKEKIEKDTITLEERSVETILSLNNFKYPNLTQKFPWLFFCFNKKLFKAHSDWYFTILRFAFPTRVGLSSVTRENSRKFSEMFAVPGNVYPWSPNHFHFPRTGFFVSRPFTFLCKVHIWPSEVKSPHHPIGCQSQAPVAGRYIINEVCGRISETNSCQLNSVSLWILTNKFNIRQVRSHLKFSLKAWRTWWLH